MIMLGFTRIRHSVRNSVTTVEIMSRPGMTEEREGYVVTSILFVKTTFVVTTNLSRS